MKVEELYKMAKAIASSMELDGWKDDCVQEMVVDAWMSGVDEWRSEGEKRKWLWQRMVWKARKFVRGLRALDGEIEAVERVKADGVVWAKELLDRLGREEKRLLMAMLEEGSVRAACRATGIGRGRARTLLYRIRKEATR